MATRQDSGLPLSPNVVMTLDFSSMDVEVFERRILSLVTGLRRLRMKIHAELGIQSTGKSSSFAALSATKEEQSYMWTLVRRVTRRIEKLRLLHELLEKKKNVLALEKSGVATNLMLVDALQFQVVSTIAEYESLETEVMALLCKM